MTELSDYEKLDSMRDHVLLRPGMYIGDIENSTNDFYIPDDKGSMHKQTLTTNSALIKLFDEIISNSVDESIKNHSIKTIKVNVYPLTGEIKVSDDGGIPVVPHPKYGAYIPEIIFGELMSGTNFNDNNRAGAGTHGLGAKLAVIYSEWFTVETSDGKNSFFQTFSNNMKDRTSPCISKSSDKGTTITFCPDYSRFKCSLDDDNISRIKKRVYDVAGCNPTIKVYWNDELIKIKSFEDYAKLFGNECVSDDTEKWKICVSPSKDDTFEHTSFVNGVDTFNGGTHVEYVCTSIITKIRDYIKKKHKIEIKPNNIKQQMHLFISCYVNAPTFPSQTKEFLSSQPNTYQSSWEPSSKFIKGLLESPIVQNILDWAAGEQRKVELAELKKAAKEQQKNNFLKKIIKFDDATSKDRSQTSILLTEGDSAQKVILSARDPKIHGVFPLRGKMKNVREGTISEIIKNEEIHNLCGIIGLQLGKECSIADLRFNRVVVCSDADLDGAHIFGLFINFIHEFWPNLIKEGFVWRLKTPIIVISKGKQEIEFLEESEYNEWIQTNSIKGWHVTYQKGLGGWTTKEFTKYLTNSKYYQQLEYGDDIEGKKFIDLAFDKKKADERKEWLTK